MYIKRLKAEKKKKKREAKKEKEKQEKLLKASQPKEQTTIFASGFPKDIQRQELVEFFEKRGALRLNLDGLL